MPSDPSKYFASQPTDRIGQEMMARVNDFYTFVRSSGWFSRMYRSWRAYYGLNARTGGARSDQITFGGDEGELSMMKVNHYRNIAQHLLTLTTAQRPAPIPVSTNTDNKSHAQTTLASGLLDYYSREKRVERILRTAAEYAIVFSEGYVKAEWDTSLGQEYGREEVPVNPDKPEEGFEVRSIREGDLKFSVLTPLDVIKDPYLETYGDTNWVILRSFVNRYELAARHPAYKDAILGKTQQQYDAMRFMVKPVISSDENVAVYELWHRKTAAVPEGRYTIAVDASAVLYDGDLPYEDIPLRRICPGDLIGSPSGYTPMFDLLALQEALDALYSAIVTNQTTFGVQNIWVPESANLSYDQLANGLNLIKTSGDKKPESLNLTHTAPEVFNFIRQLEDSMETLSGVNSTVRGNPEASLKSGSALALVQSQAIQFSSGLQASYAQLVEDVFTDALNILKEFAKTKRVALIVGKYNQHLLKEFTGDDLSSISRVVVESAGSLAKTTSGRMQIAQDLLQNQLIRTPEEYLSVINTGKLEPMTEGQTRQLYLIRQENERLANGIACRALPTDNHILHIKENSTVLDDPELRSSAEAGDPEADAVLSAAYQHLLEHVGFAADPALANLISSLGYQPIAAPLPPEQAAGGTPPADAGGQMPPPAEPNAPMGPTLPIAPDGQLPDLGGKALSPDFPSNPATGQPWNPADGGDALAGAVAANQAAAPAR